MDSTDSHHHHHFEDSSDLDDEKSLPETLPAFPEVPSIDDDDNMDVVIPDLAATPHVTFTPPAPMDEPDDDDDDDDIKAAAPIPAPPVKAAAPAPAPPPPTPKPKKQQPPPPPQQPKKPEATVVVVSPQPGSTIDPQEFGFYSLQGFGEKYPFTMKDFKVNPELKYIFFARHKASGEPYQLIRLADGSFHIPPNEAFHNLYCKKMVNGKRVTVKVTADAKREAIKIASGSKEAKAISVPMYPAHFVAFKQDKANKRKQNGKSSAKSSEDHPEEDAPAAVPPPPKKQQQQQKKKTKRPPETEEDDMPPPTKKARTTTANNEDDHLLMQAFRAQLPLLSPYNVRPKIFSHMSRQLITADERDSVATLHVWMGQWAKRVADAEPDSALRKSAVIRQLTQTDCHPSFSHEVSPEFALQMLLQTPEKWEIFRHLVEFNEVEEE